MPLETSLQRQQSLFANYLRDPDTAAAPPVDASRLKVYRELFFNNIRDLLAGGFPVLHTLLGKDEWAVLIRRFYRDHRCQTALFPELAAEFLDWLATQPPSPAFLYELAHYEWVELGLALDECDAGTPASPESSHVCVSPLAWPLAYRFEVHRLCSEYQPQQPPENPTYLLARRDVEDIIHFHQIDALTFHLLHSLIENEGRQSTQGVIHSLASQSPQESHATIVSALQERLHSLFARHVLIGP